MADQSATARNVRKGSPLFGAVIKRLPGPWKSLTASLSLSLSLVLSFFFYIKTDERNRVDDTSKTRGRLIGFSGFPTMNYLKRRIRFLTGFYFGGVFPGFCWVLLRFTAFYRVLPSFT